MKDLIKEYHIPFIIGAITVLITYVLPIHFLMPNEELPIAILKTTMLIFLGLACLVLFVLVCALLTIIGNRIITLYNIVKDYLDYR